MTFMVGPLLVLGAAALAFLALVLSLLVPPRRGFVSAFLALAIPLVGIGYGAYVGNEAQSIPPIHDISTDVVDPPGFSQAVIEARARVPMSNDLDLLAKRTSDGRAFIDLQRETYADIQAIETTVTPGVAWQTALSLAQEQGWSVGYTDAEAGIIEATATTFWYGFTDDIVIRVRPEGERVLIDMRSVSRVGRSDLGANAARMRPYLNELSRRLAERG